MVKVNKILFPCDLTDNSSKVLPYVLSMAEKFGSQIYLLHVVQDLQKWGNVFIPHSSTEVYQKEAMQGAEKAMNRVCEEQLKTCPNFKRGIVSGDPSSKILETIVSEDIDLVVRGTHGRKGLEHAIFGSVAENVVKKSPVPVLIVNPHKVK
jgi:nucleotide-binding universal stress UspA family protein